MPGDDFDVDVDCDCICEFFVFAAALVASPMGWD